MTAASVVSLLAIIAASLRACSGQTSLDDDIFVPVQAVGNPTGGLFRTFQGCTSNGATLSSMQLWAGAHFIRGMSVQLTDGSSMLYGCLNATGSQDTGCSNTKLRQASFSFQTGERVANLTLWPGYDPEGVADRRAGAITLLTSTGRVFDFGMTDPRVNPVNVSVGSGIPCGVALRSGDDIDALGFAFLQPVKSSTLNDVFYFSFPSKSAGVNLDASPLEANTTELVLGSQVYNNSGNSTGLVGSFASSQLLPSELSWSGVPGLDGYLQSSATAALPQPTANASANSTNGWSLGPVGLFNRSQDSMVQRNWSQVVAVGPGGVSQATATVLQASFQSVYAANLSVSLDTGSNISVPVQGTFEASVTSTVAVNVTVLQPPVASAATVSTAGSPVATSGSNSNTTLAWVLGVLIGVLGALLLIALILLAAVLLVRRRRQSKEEPPQHPLKWYMAFGKGRGGTQAGRDVEMGPRQEGKPDADGAWSLKAKKSSENLEPVADAVEASAESVRPSGQGQSSGSNSAGGQGGSGRMLMPYAVFKSLWLESLSGSGANKKSRDQDRQPAREEDRLSEPASGASTPKSVSPASGPVANTAESVEGLEAAAQRDAVVEDGITDAPGAPREPFVRNPRLKDRVAAVMAMARQRKKEAHPVGAADSTPPADRAGASSSPREEAGATTDKVSVSSESSSKRSATSLMLARMMSAFGPSSKIQHEDHIISLGGRGNAESTPAAAAPPAARKPTTPRKVASVEHEDSTLQLGAGYITPADARSVQKDAIEVENQRVKLGAKYATQGRNE